MADSDSGKFSTGLERYAMCHVSSAISSIADLLGDLRPDSARCRLRGINQDAKRYFGSEPPS